MADKYMTKAAQEKRNKKTKAKIGKELKKHKKGVGKAARAQHELMYGPQKK
jgi:hypothetical protein